MGSRIKLSLRSDPRFLKAVRGLVRRLCELGGLSQQESWEVTLAVDEALSNIIRHGYGGETDKPIIMTCELEEGRLEFTLEDFGRPVEREEVAPREPAGLGLGGLGLHFIRSVMDEVDYQKGSPRGTRLRLVKSHSERGG
ncbi:MAG: ATP-binding protein [Nitrospinota bacterium]